MDEQTFTNRKRCHKPNVMDLKSSFGVVDLGLIRVSAYFLSVCNKVGSNLSQVLLCLGLVPF